MFGTWILNITFGFFGFILVFFSALSNNGIITSLIRGIIAYVSFFLIAYLFRWMIHFIISDPKGNTNYNPKDKHTLKKNISADELRGSIDQLNTEDTSDTEVVSHYIKHLLKDQD